MPSGAKKRKAAKKKKQKGTDSNNPQGDYELKSQSQDEKGSDGGEGGSPAYRDGERAFSEERSDEVAESDLSAAQPSAVVAESVEDAPNDIKIDDEAGGGKDFIVGGSRGSKGVSVDDFEPAKESDYGNGNSGRGEETFTFTAKDSRDEPYNSVQQTVAFDELVKSIDSSHAKMTSITQNAAVEETVNSLEESSADSVKGVTFASEVKRRDAGNALVDKPVASQLGENDLAAKELGYGNGNSSSGSHDETFTFTAKSSKDEPYNSVKETVGFDELVKSIDSSHAKMTSITQNIPVKETVNSVVESPADSVQAVTSASEVKRRDDGNALVEKSVGSQVGANDLAGKTKEDKVHPFSDQDARTSSLEEPRPKKFDDQVSASVSHGRKSEPTNGAEHDKDSEIQESSENQPLVASAPHTAQKTSWLSCCGLFEVLSGSSR